MNTYPTVSSGRRRVPRSLMRGRPKVLIVGGSFAGIAAARRLSAGYEVTVVDPADQLEFIPNVHEVVSGRKAPSAVSLPRRRIVERLGHRFVRDAVESLDFNDRVARLRSGSPLAFDACLLACGTVSTLGAIPGAASYGLPLRSAADAAQIRRALSQHAGTGRKLRVALAGAGLVGVELLGEVLRGHGRHPGLQIDVIDAGELPLASESPALGMDLLQRCQRLPVHWHSSERIEAVSRDWVHLEGGESIGYDLLLWCAGNRPAPLLANADLLPRDSSRVPTDPTLRHPVIDSLWVVGDAAAPPSAPAQQAYHALAQGELAARNIERALRGLRGMPLQRTPEIRVITFGDISTYLSIGNHAFAGRALAPMKEAIYQLQMARLDPPFTPGAWVRGQWRSLAGIRDTLPPLLRNPAQLAGVRQLA